MPDFEKIAGQKVIEIFHQLHGDKTLVKISFPHMKYERLTVITNLRQHNNVRTFQIASPEGLNSIIQESEPGKISFEFTSSDHLPHRFTAAIQDAGPQEVWLTYPEYIQRHQLRNNFRIKVPTEDPLQVQIDQTEVHMIIDNISLGGAFCHCPNRHKPLFKERQRLERLEMSFTLGGHCIEVPIERAVVRRIDAVTRRKHFGVALEFTQMSNEARKKLTQQIYDIQRYYLQKRRKTFR